MRPLAITPLSLFVMLVALTVGTPNVTAQKMKLITMKTDSGVHLRWIGNIDPSAQSWDVYRSANGETAVKLNRTPVKRLLQFSEMTKAVGRYVSLYNLTLHGVNEERNLTQRDVERVLQDDGVGFYLALNAAEPELAKLTGEYFFDANPPVGTVTYAIVPAGDEPSNFVTSFSFTTDSTQQIPIPESIVGRGADAEAQLRWPRNPQQTLKGEVVGFRVWRATSAEGPFEELTLQTNVPFFVEGADTNTFEYSDADVENGTTYFYFVEHVHATGVRSPRSDIIAVDVGSDASAPIPLQFTASRLGHVTKLQWQYRDGAPKPVSQELWRQAFHSDEWEVTAVPAADTFTIDASATVGSGYRYLLASISLVDTSFSDTASMFLADNIAPLPPDSVWTVADTGKITVYFSASIDADVEGYHVYRSVERSQGVLLQLTNDLLTTLSFVDTLDKTTEETFGYVVKAMDNAGNISQASAVAKARVLDITPPAPSQIFDFNVALPVVSMKWSASHSVDAAEYRVERQHDSLPWNMVWKGASTSYTDSVLGSGVFRYRITVVDGTGNVSKPSQVRSTVVAETLPTPDGVRTVEEEFGIRIEWKSVPRADGYRVVRIDPKTKERIECANLPAVDMSWTDRLSSRTNEWVYEVAARDAKWRFGPASTALFQPMKK